MTWANVSLGQEGGGENNAANQQQQQKKSPFKQHTTITVYKTGLNLSCFGSFSSF